MDWLAITWSGFVATTLAAAFFWLVRSFGWTRFSPTVQLGCLFFRDPRSPHTETAGFLLFLLVGSSVVPAVYALMMPLLDGPSWESGAGIGVAHGLLTAAALPALGTISACIRHGLIPAPGRFGLGWGWPTPVGVVAGHLLYGGVAGAILAGF